MIKTSVVVADAGPLIHLDELTALDVLRIYDEIWVPNAVWSEVAYHRPQALEQSPCTLRRLDAPDCSNEVASLATLLTLHRGELEALSLCVKHSISTIVTDDTAVRMAADCLNLKAHGTLGLLIQSMHHNIRKPHEVLELLESIPSRSTLHIRPGLLQKVIMEFKDKLEAS